MMPSTRSIRESSDVRLDPAPPRSDPNPRSRASLTMLSTTAASQRRADHVVATRDGPLVRRERAPVLQQCSVAADPSSSMSLEALCLRGWKHQSEEAQRMGLAAGTGTIRPASEPSGLIGGDSAHPPILVRPGDAWQQGAEGRTVVDRSHDRLRLVGSLRGLLRVLDDDDGDEVDEAVTTGVRACTYEATDEAGGGGAFNLRRPSDFAATTEGLMAKQ
jgi:hypothetical protein